MSNESTVPKGSSDTNFTFLVGRMVADPELGHTKSGTAYCKYTVVTNRVFTRRDGTRVQEPTYHDIIQWQGAESTAKFGSKGRLVGIEAAIGKRDYTSRAFGDIRPLREFAASLEGQKNVSVEKVLAAINGIEMARQTAVELTCRRLTWLGPNPNQRTSTTEAPDELPDPDETTEAPF